MIDHAPLYFSIIVPTRNRPAELTHCLHALARQDYPRDQFQIIVVDDASAMPLDNILAALPDDMSVTLVRQAHARNRAAARNRGAQSARGAFLAFTDDDCAPAPGWLRAFGERLNAAPGIAFGGLTLNALDRNYFSVASQLLADYFYAAYNPDPSRAQFFTSNNFAIARELFLALQGFDPTFAFFAEDRDFCDRWLVAGRQLVYVPEAVVSHAHPYTFSFLRQHWNFGRGAWHFNNLRAQRHHLSRPFQSPRFYFDLVTYPLQKFSFWRAVPLIGLMLLMQIANAAGWVYERMRR